MCLAATATIPRHDSISTLAASCALPRNRDQDGALDAPGLNSLVLALYPHAHVCVNDDGMEHVRGGARRGQSLVAGCTPCGLREPWPCCPRRGAGEEGFFEDKTCMCESLEDMGLGRGQVCPLHAATQPLKPLRDGPDKNSQASPKTVSPASPLHPPDGRRQSLGSGSSSGRDKVSCAASCPPRLASTCPACAHLFLSRIKPWHTP